MILVETLQDLWRLLDRRGRIVAAGLVFLLGLSGALEMGGIFFLFGYIAALSGGSGIAGSNVIVDFYRGLAGDLEDAAFAAAAGAILIGIFAFKNIVALLTNFALLRFCMKRYEVIATRLFSGFLHVRLELLLHRGTLGPQQVLQSVLRVFRASFAPGLQALSEIAILATMVIALMYVVDPWLVLLAGGLLGSGAAAYLWLTRRLSVELGERQRTAERLVRRIVLEGFRGLIDIRLAGRQDHMLARYRRVSGDFSLNDRRARALEMTPRLFNELMLACGIVVAAVYFGTNEGGLSAALPTLAVLGFAGLRVTAALSRLTSALQRMRETAKDRQILMDSIGRSAPELLDSVTEPGAKEDYLAESRPLPAGKQAGLGDKISLEEVCFTYPGSEAPALEDVSLEIPRGAFVGICGPSGGGKSTLALVIMGLLRPQAGLVRCDDWNVFEHLRDWHANIGYVGQTPFIAPRNVRENVAFGYAPEEIDDAKVWHALEMASVADVIRARAEGLEAPLGEEGVLLSGGQRQRIAIARALYHDPEVLVFDEATAALDTATEKEVSASIAALSGTKTVICIAHRLTTIHDSDVVYFVEGGRIGMSGSFDELEGRSERVRMS